MKMILIKCYKKRKREKIRNEPNNLQVYDLQGLVEEEIWVAERSVVEKLNVLLYL